jgi:YD repeat-containing protein
MRGRDHLYAYDSASNLISVTDLWGGKLHL